MTTLEEAWAWYQANRSSLRYVSHLAKYWGAFPWGQDHDWVNRVADNNVLRTDEPDELVRFSEIGLKELEDLAVLVLFSVFEAIVRDIVEAQIRPEVNGLKHPHLIKAGQDVLKGIEDGSFFRILEPYKSKVHSDLIEQVNQVRRYRNWVAHGRRIDNPPDAFVDPKMAYDRLREFLRLIQPDDPTT